MRVWVYRATEEGQDIVVVPGLEAQLPIALLRGKDRDIVREAARVEIDKIAAAELAARVPTRPT